MDTQTLGMGVKNYLWDMYTSGVCLVLRDRAALNGTKVLQGSKEAAFEV